MQSLEPTLAIDFGTCTSAAARMRDGRPLAVKDPIRKWDWIPSAVLLRSSGDEVVGFMAENGRRARPSYFADEFKRDLGRSEIVLGDEGDQRSYGAEQLVAKVLAFLRTEAEKTDGPHRQVVLTIPSSYESRRKQLMLSAGAAAGFEQVQLLEEPIAAVMARGGARDSGDELLLVYDLGGGTFDAAVVRRRDGRDEVLRSAGVKDFGGIDVDRAIERDLVARAGPALRDLLSLEAAGTQDERLRAMEARLVVRDFCREQVKHALSVVEHAEGELLVAGGVSYDLDRSALERLVAPGLDRTIACCEDLLEKSGHRWADLDGVLLVGGTCHLGFIRERIERHAKVKATLVDQPELAVCHGAAVWAAAGEQAQAPPAQPRKRPEPVVADAPPRGARPTPSTSPVPPTKPPAPPPPAPAPVQDDAEAAYRRADERGDAHAACALGILLERRGDDHAAEAAYGRACDRGSATAMYRLALLRERREDLAGAQALLRDAAEAGHGAAAHALGALLERTGDVAGALEAFVRAEGRGVANAACRLGMLLERRNELPAAVAAYDRADGAGDREGALRLGLLRYRLGDAAQADACWRRAADRGSAAAVNNLGVLHEHRGDVAAAQAAYRSADERGETAGAFNWGALAERRGDLAGAESAYRSAAGRGNGDAAYNLGLMLRARGDLAGAEAAYRRAVQCGNTAASNNLGIMAHERGDMPAAEVAYRRADTAGSGDGAGNLGLLLLARGDAQGSKAAFRRAASRGPGGPLGRSSMGQSVADSFRTRPRLLIAGTRHEGRLLVTADAGGPAGAADEPEPASAAGLRESVAALVASRRIEKLVQGLLPRFADDLGQALARGVTERHVLPALLAWRRNEISTLDEAAARIAARVATDGSIFVGESLAARLAPWRDELVAALDELTRPICLRWGLDPKAMALRSLTVDGEGRIDAATRRGRLEKLDAIAAEALVAVIDTPATAGVATQGPIGEVVGGMMGDIGAGGAMKSANVPPRMRAMRSEAKLVTKLRAGAPARELALGRHLAAGIVRHEGLAAAIAQVLGDEIEALAAKAERALPAP